MEPTRQMFSAKRLEDVVWRAVSPRDQHRWDQDNTIYIYIPTFWNCFLFLHMNALLVTERIGIERTTNSTILSFSCLNLLNSLDQCLLRRREEKSTLYFFAIHFRMRVHSSANQPCVMSQNALIPHLYLWGSHVEVLSLSLSKHVEATTNHHL